MPQPPRSERFPRSRRAALLSAGHSLPWNPPGSARRDQLRDSPRRVRVLRTFDQCPHRPAGNTLDRRGGTRSRLCADTRRPNAGGPSRRAEPASRLTPCTRITAERCRWPDQLLVGEERRHAARPGRFSPSRSGRSLNPATSTPVGRRSFMRRSRPSEACQKTDPHLGSKYAENRGAGRRKLTKEVSGRRRDLWASRRKRARLGDLGPSS